MNKKFIERVEREIMVDTKKYRYVLNRNDGSIERLPIEYLDTTRALDEWEKVYHA